MSDHSKQNGMDCKGASVYLCVRRDCNAVILVGTEIDIDIAEPRIRDT